MGYTVNKPKNMYDNTEEFKRRSRELRDEAKNEIEKQRKHIEDLRNNLAQYTCATIYNPNMYTCVSYAEPMPQQKINRKSMNIYEEKIEELSKELKIMAGDNALLKSQNALLFLELKKLNEGKAKKEKQKNTSNFFKDFGGEVKSIYDKFIKWLNT